LLLLLLLPFAVAWPGKRRPSAAFVYSHSPRADSALHVNVKRSRSGGFRGSASPGCPGAAVHKRAGSTPYFPKLTKSAPAHLTSPWLWIFPAAWLVGSQDFEVIGGSREPAVTGEGVLEKFIHKAARERPGSVFLAFGTQRLTLPRR